MDTEGPRRGSALVSFFGFLGFRAQPLAGRRVLVSMRFLFVVVVLSFLLAGLRVAAPGPPPGGGE